VYIQLRKKKLSFKKKKTKTKGATKRGGKVSVQKAKENRLAMVKKKKKRAKDSKDSQREKEGMDKYRATMKVDTHTQAQTHTTAHALAHTHTCKHTHIHT
jgi:hypothetical protein